MISTICLSTVEHTKTRSSALRTLANQIWQIGVSFYALVLALLWPLSLILKNLEKKVKVSLSGKGNWFWPLIDVWVTLTYVTILSDGCFAFSIIFGRTCCLDLGNSDSFLGGSVLTCYPLGKCVTFTNSTVSEHSWLGLARWLKEII